jgi:hypothetical protein
MTAYAFSETGAEILSGTAFVGPDGTGYPANWLERATEDQREAAGIVEIVETDPPAGERVTGRGTAVVDGVVTRTWTTEAFDEAGVEALRAGKVAEVHAEAARRINEVMTDRQQRRALARGIQLVTTLGADAIAWPRPGDGAEYDEIMAAWARIQAIEDAEDTLAAAVPADDAAAIGAFDVAGAPAWPA